MKVGPHPASGILTRGGKLGHGDTHGGMPSAKEAEDGLMYLHTEELQGLLAPGDGGLRQGTASQSFQKAWLCRHLHFRILASRAVRRSISAVSDHPVCGDLLLIQSSREPMGLCQRSRSPARLPRRHVHPTTRGASSLFSLLQRQHLNQHLTRSWRSKLLLKWINKRINKRLNPAS